MNRDKCKNCKYYDKFFDSCNIYYKEVYLNEGDFDLQPVSIKEIDETECEYEKK